MSVLRSLAVRKTEVTNVGTPHTLSYYDTTVDIGGDTGWYVPIPFTVSNGVLDIAVIDGVAAELLNPNTYNYDVGSYTDLQASVMGGLAPVSSLGPNMIAFLKNYITEYETDDVEEDYNDVTNIEIYNAPTMTKIRYNYIYSFQLYKFSNVAPVKTTPDPVSGEPSNNYRVVWIFKSPLVVSYKFDGSNTKYLTLTSAFDSAF